MSAEKLSVSLDSETVARARRAADRDGVPLSSWLDRAARRVADLEEARIALEEHFAVFGEPTADVEAQARSVIEATGIGRPVPADDDRANQAALAYLDRYGEVGDE
ncbi:hypothetical protein AB0M72_04190 [Nocardiopsis dassonvillei]